MNQQEEKFNIREEQINQVDQRLEKTISKMQEEVYFAWVTDEHRFYERGIAWYVIAVVITLALLFYAFYEQNLPFAIIILLAATLIYLNEKKGDKIISVIFAESGMYYNEKLIPYDTMSEFYIIYNPPYISELYIEFKNFRPRLRIDLESVDPILLRRFFLEFLPENTEKETIPASEFISRILKL